MTKNITFVANSLLNLGFKCEIYLESDRLLTAVSTDNIDVLPIVASFTKDGRVLEFCAPVPLQAEDSVFKGPLFQTLLAISNEVRLLRFSYNPANGEIIATTEVPIVDSVLTEGQVIYCLRLLVQLVDESMPRLRAVLATGTDPGYKSALERLLEELPDDSVERIAKIVALRQQQRRGEQS